jgi:hypothetical protein
MNSNTTVLCWNNVYKCMLKVPKSCLYYVVGKQFFFNIFLYAFKMF